MSTRINIMAITAIGILVGAAGVLIWYSAYVKPELDKKDERIASMAEDIEQIVLANSASDDGEQAGELPVHAFEPAGAFSPEEKSEIKLKLIEPYFDYHNEQTMKAATMNIREQGSQWSVFVINLDGSTDSFTFGNPEAETQAFWQPDCNGGCDFSNTFRAKYPQIAS